MQDIAKTPAFNTNIISTTSKYHINENYNSFGEVIVTNPTQGRIEEYPDSEDRRRIEEDPKAQERRMTEDSDVQERRKTEDSDSEERTPASCIPFACSCKHKRAPVDDENMPARLQRRLEKLQIKDRLWSSKIDGV